MESGYVGVGMGQIFSTNEKRLKDCFEYKDLVSVLSNKVLFSFGSGLSKKTVKFNKDKYLKAISSQIKQLKEKSKTSKEMTLYIDSGGFQCACGYIPKNQLKDFVDIYAQFLVNEIDNYDYAFSLDLPPSDYLFDDWDEMYEFNKYSYYKLFVDLPENVRKKIILVKHFRTPSQLNVWHRLLEDENIIKGFNSNYWSIGGIVASSSGDQTIPYITYSIPISDIVEYSLKHNKTQVNLHILGGCAYRDLFYYSLVKKYIKIKTNIDFEFTYDSSGIIKQIILGRYINPITEDGLIQKIFFTSDKMDYKINGKRTEDIVLDEMRKMLKYAKIENVEIPDKIYLNGKLHPVLEALLTTYQLYTFKKLKNFFDSFCDTLTEEDFDNEDIFKSKTYDILRKINGLKVTTKFKNKTNNLHRSILYVIQGNKEKNIKLIDYYTTKDEIKFGPKVAVDTF